MLLKILIIINHFIIGCVSENTNDSQNLECILTLEKKSDITNNIIAECSKLASKDKFTGYLCLCRINRLNNKTDLAVLSCSKAKIKNPFSVYPHIEFADIYLSKNNKDIAKTEIEFALSIDSHNFHANLKAAEIYESLKKEEKALVFYQKALDILKNSNSSYVIGKKSLIEKKINKISYSIKTKKEKEQENKYLNCISSYKKEKDPHAAVEKIETCLKMKKIHSNTVYIDYLKLLYSNSKYSEFIQTFKKLNIPTNNEINKMLADSYYHLKDYTQAVKNYKTVIKDDTYDTETLYRYALSLEKTQDKVTAAEIYSKIYSIKPSPSLAEKIDELKMDTMSDSDILNDLKIRGFIKEKTVLLPPEKKLFLSVKLIERKGAVKYLEEKYPGYANILWKNPENEDDIRITYSGFLLYLKNISQKFLKEIQKTALDPRDIFVVKDANGNDIFDKNGSLTYEGLKCYYEYENSKIKNWYFTHETPPVQTPQTSYMNPEKNADFLKKRKEIEKLGYEEITETEYLWLIRVTNCPEEVLENSPCSVRKLDSGNGMKYFICMKEGMCNSYQTTLASYITSYRNGHSEVIESKYSTGFFGSAGTPKKKFCENGQIWTGSD